MVDLRRRGNAPGARPRRPLATLSSLGEAKVFFTSGGGDAVDTAAKLSASTGRCSASRERLHIISRTNGVPRDDGVRDVDRRNRGEPGRLRAARRRVRPRCSGTPLRRWRTRSSSIGRRPGRRLLRRARDRRRRRAASSGRATWRRRAPRSAVTPDILFVCDSVICGFGRLGTWLGFERFGIEPDLVTFAKGVTSGYLPLGGVVVSRHVAEPFWTEPGRVFVRHGQTYAGHADGLRGGSREHRRSSSGRASSPRGRSSRSELLSTLDAARRSSARRRGPRRHRAASPGSPSIRMHSRRTRVCRRRLPRDSRARCDPAGPWPVRSRSLRP